MSLPSHTPSTSSGLLHLPVDADTTKNPPFRKDAFFWLSFLALPVASFISALDLTAVSTALPTIVDSLHDGQNDFTWIGSVYSLASTAVLPLSGKLADVFGRRPVMLAYIIIFACGSAAAGTAQSLFILIAARALQGIGGGGIINLQGIIMSDLVPLSERGPYQGIIGMTWALASGVGPPIGAALSQMASWRWIFYMNLPLDILAFVLIFFCLRVRVPEGSIKAKLARADWIGNVIIIVGTTLAIVGLTFGGIQYPWGSVQVLAPLIIGLILIACFLVYEIWLPKDREPTIPWEILKNRTSLCGFIASGILGTTSISIFYYLPTFFQACLVSTPLRSSVQTLPTTLLVAPAAIVSGVLVQRFGKYRLQIVVGWILVGVGLGLMTLLSPTNTTGEWVGYQICSAVGIGVLLSSHVFAVLAPLPVECNAAALGFSNFLSSFGQSWGITISGTILQNELQKNLPASFVSQFPPGAGLYDYYSPSVRRNERKG